MNEELIESFLKVEEESFFSGRDQIPGIDIRGVTSEDKKLESLKPPPIYKMFTLHHHSSCPNADKLYCKTHSSVNSHNGTQRCD